MHISKYTIQSSNTIFSSFHTSIHGLTPQEVHKRKQEYGLNEISGEEVQWWHVLLRQFKSPFLYLLLITAVLSFFFGEIIDGCMILLFISIDTMLGFYQEFHSEQTLKLLKQYVQGHTRVIREGIEEHIKTTDLVPGDIVMLEAGDIIPADIRFVEETNVTVDESVLTGESVSVKKVITELPKEAQEIYQAENIGFSGTTVVTGKGKGVIIATGKNTALGEITHLTVETHRESSFEKGVARFSRFILRLILGTLVLIFLINIIIKGGNVHFPTLFVFAIALAVSVIPEALPVVMTFSLSRGALHLAKNHVVVKRLSAIEDLGSIEILCTDKTGTLTENIMTVDGMYPRHDTTLLMYGALGSTLLAKKSHSIHSFDVALWDALSVEDKKIFETYKRVIENPFDPDRKRSSMLIKKDHTSELVVRGAPEVIMHLCTNISQEEKHHITSWIQQQGAEGKRIIALAKKEFSDEVPADLISEEKHLHFLGLISFIDPIKKSTFEAVTKAKAMGIQIKILTGDSREVAGAVAHKIGLITDPKEVITGEEFDALHSSQQHEIVHSTVVFARVSPQQKYKIIQLLQEKYEVGFLGEGINDAPALKIANVAIVVQGATDVARESADILLLKRSLKVVVDGIKEGRAIFANTSKYIRATLSSNFGNFYTVAIASLFIDFLPLLPIQILLINLLTDFPMIAVATDNVDSEELARPRNYDIKEIALVGTLLGVVSSIFDFMFFILFYKISPGVLQTNWFMGSVLTELLFLFSIRTKLSIFKAKPPSFILLGLSALAFVTAIILPFIPIGQTVFSFITPTPFDLLRIIGIALAYFVVTEVVKVWYYRMQK
jgi:P-type Mg2+ transporter